MGVASLFWAIVALYASWIFSSWPHDVACARRCGSVLAAWAAAPQLLPAQVNRVCFQTGLRLSAFFFGS